MRMTPYPLPPTPHPLPPPLPIALGTIYLVPICLGT